MPCSCTLPLLLSDGCCAVISTPTSSPPLPPQKPKSLTRPSKSIVSSSTCCILAGWLAGWLACLFTHIRWRSASAQNQSRERTNERMNEYTLDNDLSAYAHRMLQLLLDAMLAATAAASQHKARAGLAWAGLGRGYCHLLVVQSVTRSLVLISRVLLGHDRHDHHHDRHDHHHHHHRHDHHHHHRTHRAIHRRTIPYTIQRGGKRERERE